MRPGVSRSRRIQGMRPIGSPTAKLLRSTTPSPASPDRTPPRPLTMRWPSWRACSTSTKTSGPSKSSRPSRSPTCCRERPTPPTAGRMSKTSSPAPTTGSPAAKRSRKPCRCNRSGGPLWPRSTPACHRRCWPSGSTCGRWPRRRWLRRWSATVFSRSATPASSPRSMLLSMSSNPPSRRRHTKTPSSRLHTKTPSRPPSSRLQTKTPSSRSPRPRSRG